MSLSTNYFSRLFIPFWPLLHAKSRQAYTSLPSICCAKDAKKLIIIHSKLLYREAHLWTTIWLDLF